MQREERAVQEGGGGEELQEGGFGEERAVEALGGVCGEGEVGAEEREGVRLAP